MKKSILFAITVVLAGAAVAYDYDRLLDAIHVSGGAYFDTGCAVKSNPRVVASVSVDTTDSFDIFGMGTRGAGCWILNLDDVIYYGGTGRFYYRYGTSSSGGERGAFTLGQRLDLDCGRKLVVNGREYEYAADYDFSANTASMTIPGETRASASCTIMAFQIWDGGALVRDFVPAEKNGECGLYDRVGDQFYRNAGSGTVTAAYGRLVDAIHIPNGAYFNTRCIVTDNPRVIADVRPDTTSDFDVFGVNTRVDGCWILNLDYSEGLGPRFYYRYGTAASGGGVGSFAAGQRLEIDCGRTLIVNGNVIQTAADYNFAANNAAMTIPGEDRGACVIRSFQIWDAGQLVRDFVPAEKDGAYGLYDRVAGQFYANEGSGTVTAEPYDHLLEAIHIPSGAYFNTGCVVTDNPRVIADVSADTTAEFDLFGVKTRSDGCWILNLDSGYIYYRYGTASSIPLEWPIYVAGRRFQVDCGKTILVNGTALANANYYDFSANDTAMTVPGTEDPGACTLWSFKIEDGGQLVRDFIPAEKNGECGLYDRINKQFYANAGSGTVTPVATKVPTDLAAKLEGFPSPVTVLSWRPALGSSSTTILRSPGANGPWTEIAQVSGGSTYADTTAPVGAQCYYRVAANFAIGGANFALTNESSVAFRRCRILERDPGDMAHLRSGVNLIYDCGQTCWTPSGTAEYTWEAVTNSLMLAFDNVLYYWRPENSSAGVPYVYDYADTAASATRTCIGVDLGEPAHVAYVRFFAITSEARQNRLNGVRLYGSNDANWNQSGNDTPLTEPLKWTAESAWYEKASIDADNTYRYLFCNNITNSAWGNNVSELQFYGWLDSDLENVAESVADLAATCGTTPAVTLTWTPVVYGTYTIERKTGDGAWATVASALPAATATWMDTGVVCDGTAYAYRVTTVNSGMVAYSEDLAVRPYLAGNGIGLHGEWWTNYVATTSGEALALATTNAMIDIANASVGGETENLFVRWSGKLIVPFAGDYVFDADADGGLYLWVDGNPVLYNGASSGTINLTAGEHDVTATWYHRDGIGSCHLYWSGSVGRAVIPASQLVPVVPRALPKGWTNARSFDADASSLYLGDVKANADGSLDFAQSGRGLFNDISGYNFLWQSVKGDFMLTAKMASLPVANQWLWRRAGLMVRSSLDATAMMNAYGVYREEGDLYVVESRQKTTATAPNIATQAKVAGATLDSYSATPTWVRLIREGNKFTCLYRIADAGEWLKLYEYEDVSGEYGETVYAGLAAWGDGYGSDTAIPYYLWRFSKVSLHPLKGTRIIIR